MTNHMTTNTTHTMVSKHFNHPVDPCELLNNYGWNRCRIAYQWLNGCLRKDKHGILEAMELNSFTDRQISIMAEAYDAMTI